MTDGAEDGLGPFAAGAPDVIEDVLRASEERFRAAALAFTAVLDPSRVFQLVVDAARDLVGVEHVALGIVEANSEGLERVVESASPESGERIGAAAREALTAVLGQRRAVRMARSGDGAVSIGFPEGHPSLRSLLGVPVAFGGRVLGALCLSNKVAAATFDYEDEALAAALAAQAAVAIENAKAYERVQDLASRLDRANAELARANDLKLAFLARMSHELRTPLSAILIASEMMEDPAFGGLSETGVRDFAGKIAGNGRHLLGLVDDLLDIARIEAGRMEVRPRPVDLGALLGEVHAAMSPIAAGCGVGLDLRVDGDLRIGADPLRIRQVLLNLVSNALKFTPAGGRVWAEADSTDSEVGISICDDGPGIDARDIERIFEPFERAARTPGGAGLGLAIARRIVEMHGGSIEVSSKPGAGSRFTVRVPGAGVPEPTLEPRARLEAAPLPNPESPEGTEVARAGRVLVVEDDMVMLDLASRVLLRLGCRVDQAKSVGEAIRWIEGSPPDLVLLDLRLGLEDGLDVARFVRRRPVGHPDIRVVALSADSGLEHVQRAIRAGCDEHVAKPIGARGLSDLVRRVFGDRFPLDSRLYCTT